MDAWKLSSVMLNGAHGKIDDKLTLPIAFCDSCQSETLDPNLWYPSVKVKDQKQVKRYSFEPPRPIEEVEKLKANLTPKARGKKAWPGAAISPITIKLRFDAADFVSCVFHWVIVKPAYEKFVEAGVFIPAVPVEVFIGKTKSNAYLAIELDPICLYSESSMVSMQLTRCQKCSYLTTPIPGHKIWPWMMPNSVSFRKDLIPKGQGIVYAEHYDSCLVTEDFVQVYKKHKMTGLNFIKAGTWV